MKDTDTLAASEDKSSDKAVNFTQSVDTKEVKDRMDQVKVLQEKRKEILWSAHLFIWGAHIIALAGFFTFSWQAFWLCIFLHWLTGGVGITLTYHRLLTHRSFQVPKIVEYILATIACLACQGGPVSWVATHRLHHAKSDQPGDPHSPRDGFFWAHMGWCTHKNGVTEDFNAYSKFAPDLAKDKYHVFLDHFFMVPTVLLAIGLYLWGGWSFVVWGIFVRLVFVYHSTWLVNSATHVWGYQTYKTGEDSTNLWWVALLSYGEGWHNNHHAFQVSARHGMKWWEIDTTYMLIRLMEFLGIAKSVKVPSQHHLQTKQA